MRRAARTDANHADVVKALRAIGCSVLDLSAVGDGCPDLLVGIRNAARGPMLLLMELKDGDKKPSAQKLTPAQAGFHADWSGLPICMARSVGEALKLVASYREFF